MSRSKRIAGVVTAGVLFQLLWYLLVSSAGTPASVWVTLSAAVLMSGTAVVFTESAGRSLFFIAMAVALGGAMDTALTAVGCIDPARILVPAPFPPVWLIGLWVGFAGFMRVALRYLCGRPAAQFAAGVFGGPAAYYAGEKMGAVAVNPNVVVGYGLLAVSWGVICLVLFAVSCRLYSKAGGEER